MYDDEELVHTIPEICTVFLLRLVLQGLEELSKL